MNYQERKAVSPVIATVILVAVAITVSIGVSYWMGGIAGQYTDFEKVEVTSVVVTKTANLNWEAIITLKNSGSAAATIDSIFVSEVGVTLGQAAEGGSVGVPDIIHASSMAAGGLPLASGQSGSITLWIGGGLPNSYLSSGTTVNIKAHSAGGMDYIKLVKLP